MTRTPQDNTYELETDVLVLGGGGTGLAAALSAAEQGAQVVVAEKCSTLGGTTGLSIGSVTACCTSYQERQGIKDSPQALFEDIKKFNGTWDEYNNKELCWVLAREGAATVEWLRSHGFEFFGPSLEPPHRVARMHNVIPNALSFPMLFQRALQKKGVTVLLSAPARRLIQEAGRVTGAALDDAKRGTTFRVHARRGTILACGDFSASHFLKERYLSYDLANVPAYNAASEGEGHVMGIQIGARVVNMGVFKRPDVRFVRAPTKLWHEALPAHPLLIKWYVMASRIVPRGVFAKLARRILTTRGAPDEGLYRAGVILVNSEGERFTDELTNPSFQIARQTRGHAYLVFDARLAKKFSRWPYFVSTAAGIAYAYVQDYERDVPDIIAKGKTLQEAARMHPKPEALARAVNRYNRFVETGRDEDFNRSPLGEGILEPPFYVMGPAAADIGVTIGGLAVNTRLQVLDESGNVIPGLFAGGRNGGGMVIMGHGLNLAWAFTSGRLAGKYAAQSD